MGILTIVPDYRNFPQGNVEDMVTDIVAAIAWASKNARSYGGDPHKLVLAGQSAGKSEVEIQGDLRIQHNMFFRHQVKYKKNCNLNTTDMIIGAHICMCALVDALKARMDSQGQKSRNSFMNIATPVVSGLPKGFREEDSSPFRSTGRKSDLRNGNPLVREYFVGKKSDVSSQRNIPSYDRTNNARTKTGTETHGGLTDDEEGRRAACGHENEKHGQEHDGEEEEEEIGDHDTTWKSSTHTGKKSDALNTNPTTKENASTTTTDSEALLSTDLGVISSPERFGFLDTLKSPTQMAMIPIQMGLAVMRKGRDYLDKVKSKVCETIAHLEGGEEYCRNEKRRRNNDAEEVDEMSCKTLELDAIKLFVGVSGPYNILSLSSHMQSRGLDHSILKWICKGDIARYSPTLHLDRIMKDAALSISQSPLPLRTCAHPLSGDEKIFWKSSRNGNKPISEKDDKSESLTDSKKLRLKIPDNIPTDIFNGIPPFKIINRNLTAENVTSEVEDRWSQSENEEEGDEEEENRRLTLSGLNFPPVVLYHGALDISVPSTVSVEMAATISRWGGEVSEFVRELSHSLSCTVLYCTVLYCTVLHCTVLNCTSYCTVFYCTSYCTVLYCTVSYCTMLYCTVLLALHCIVLHCIVLHCIVLHCIVLCCIALYCTALCCTALYCTALCCTALCCTALYRIAVCCIALYCTALYCTALYCTALCCTALCCIALYCIALYCIALYCIALYRTALCCIALHCLICTILLVLHCIVLQCIALHCIVLHCIALHYIVLHCIVLYCSVLHCTVLLDLHCIVLHCIVLYCIVLHCIVLHCVALHCIVLHCIVLHYIVLHCIALHCIA